MLGLILGGILGAGAVQGWMKKLATAPRGELESMVLADWKKKLNLREDQAAAIKPLLGEAEGKIVPLRDAYLADVNKVLTDLHPRIRAVLDEKQRGRYQEMVKRYDAKVGAAAALGGTTPAGPEAR